jgi:transposase-like protein
VGRAAYVNLPKALPKCSGNRCATARTMLAARFLLLRVRCRSCHHAADADLQKLIDQGRGDVPVVKLRFRCTKCGSRRTDVLVTPKPKVMKPR